jgi:hypothetical protein
MKFSKPSIVISQQFMGRALDGRFDGLLCKVCIIKPGALTDYTNPLLCRRTVWKGSAFQLSEYFFEASPQITGGEASLVNPATR